MNSAPASNHIREIDGMRAIAVLAVVLYHASIRGFNGGFFGVDVFFVISGFVICGTLVEGLKFKRGIQPVGAKDSVWQRTCKLEGLTV